MSVPLLKPAPAGRARWLLLLGVLAMALHLLAGSGFARAHQGAGKGGFVPEVCTSHGVQKTDPAQHLGGEPQAGAHDCCKLCAAGASLLPASAGIGVPPAPTFAVRHAPEAALQLTVAAWRDHPPRGPPAQS